MKTIASVGLMSIFILVILFSGTALAAIPMAKITTFTGEAVVLSGADTTIISRIGQELNGGDRVQTKQGVVQVTFNDGAILKISQFTSALIQEREEESGILIFKTKKAVRRVTCFVGKMWFKSGASKRANYLQTPTAVMGLRGSDADFGFDNLNSYLNMYSGEADIIGRVMRGFFENPGVDAATKSAVYQSLQNAYAKSEQAKATGNVIDLAAARLNILEAAKAAFEELKKNPDNAVRQEAERAAAALSAALADAQKKLNEVSPTTVPTTIVETTAVMMPPIKTTITTTMITTVNATTIVPTLPSTVLPITVLPTVPSTIPITIPPITVPTTITTTTITFETTTSLSQ